MIRPLLFAAAAILAIAPATAQTGYGAPSPGQYRAEQRTTAELNDRWDDGAAEEPRDNIEERDAYARDRADYQRQRADYRRRAAEHRADLARWRARADACNDGVREACAGYEARYGSYGDGRYAPPPPAEVPRYGSYDDRAAPPPAWRYEDDRDAPDDRYADPQDDGGDDGYPGG